MRHCRFDPLPLLSPPPFPIEASGGRPLALHLRHLQGPPLGRQAQVVPRVQRPEELVVAAYRRFKGQFQGRFSTCTREWWYKASMKMPLKKITVATDKRGGIPGFPLDFGGVHHLLLGKPEHPGRLYQSNGLEAQC